MRVHGFFLAPLLELDVQACRQVKATHTDFAWLEKTLSSYADQ